MRIQNFTRWLALKNFLLCSLISLAQQITITGTVMAEDNTALAGVTVTVKGTNNATQPNATGQFSIPAAKGQTLQFSYVGYAAQKIVVGDDNTVSIKM